MKNVIDISLRCRLEPYLHMQLHSLFYLERYEIFKSRICSKSARALEWYIKNIVS